MNEEREPRPQSADPHYVRESYWHNLPPPERNEGPFAWLRDNLFSSIGNGVLTFAAAALIVWAAWALVDFAVLSAAPPGGDVNACRQAPEGACWPFIAAKLDQFIYGRYPADERWRIDVAGLLFLGAIALILLAPRSEKRITMLGVGLGYPFMAAALLAGGVFGLEPVETALWGGLSLTILITLFGMITSLPLGVLLALGRRSSWPLLRWLSIVFIEFWRGVPLITVLFMGSVMLPLFLPENVTIDKLLRALIAVALFSSAYMAEVVRGGLQSIPKGQYEAARALGLGPIRVMTLVILPQALANVIPAIVNTFTALLKETTLVLIIGLFDFLGMIQFALTDAAWGAPTTTITGYFFAALVFWCLCFSLSRYAASIERGLARSRTGGRRG
jgi:general L-amino acid transport system permease protein